MDDLSTTTKSYPERISVSPSGAGLDGWVGDEVRVRLDWEQVPQLHALLAHQLDHKGSR